MISSFLMITSLPERRSCIRAAALRPAMNAGSRLRMLPALLVEVVLRGSVTISQ